MKPNNLVKLLSKEELKKCNGKMIKIGLTGGIGTGKSTVTKMLKEKGIPVIDADVIAREVLNIYPRIVESISENFGPEFIDSYGNLRRREFGNYIFSSEDRRKKYETIIIPYIKKEIFNSFNKHEVKGSKCCILDAPTLIEQNMHKYMDLTVLVWVDKETQIKRIGKRDKLAMDQILNRINAQMPLDDKKVIADFVIYNTLTLENTEMQVDKLIDIINAL
ncbi:dephospho-CoA kinase [Clostridium tetanomorphum]|nr:dephospho-CoA kinase [Clostridium tetanomorphum DSM 665]MBP1862512.1 dephospho-CoA kinase [Clostridium tetanomorphum]KAJ53780.1 dephospho-CoA kinase [Clostridium tetanomorphum DSM 665]NRS85647.1 dephospho-CoA kinase [Clostridium tetanomorphum]NRZ96341.1 dephospho-CoA kinase [Clostridium tetanomorphum]